jgi:hypothetical protein
LGLALAVDARLAGAAFFFARDFFFGIRFSLRADLKIGPYKFT